MHLVASANVFLARDPEGTAALGKGRFEYWASGDKYRIACRTPPRLGLASDMDLAFDGRLRQLFLREMDTLMVQSGDLRQMPIALPNPFFLPIDFASPDASDCDGCALRLSDVPTLDLWDERISKWRPEELAAPDSERLRTFQVPGGTLAGEPYWHRLAVEDKGAAGRLRRIERLDPRGETLSVIELEDYRPVAGASFRFPYLIRVKVFEPGVAESVMELEYRIETLEVNRPLADDVFTLEVTEGARVWDSDAERFLEAPPALLERGDRPPPSRGN